MSEELKPCPFCGKPFEMLVNRDGSAIYKHDSDDCVMRRDDLTGWVWYNPETLVSDLNARPVEDALRAELEAAKAELQQAREAKDGAYRERDMLVAALSKIFPASLERHPDNEKWEDDWRWIVFIDLPTGQATWHIHDSELPMFDHLPRLQGRKWDGHSTDEKYIRLAALPEPPKEADDL